MSLFKPRMSRDAIAATLAASASECLALYSDSEFWSELNAEGYVCRYTGDERDREIAFLIAYGTHVGLVAQLTDAVKAGDIEGRFFGKFISRLNLLPEAGREIEVTWFRRMREYDAAMATRVVWAEKLYAMGEVAADRLFVNVPAVQGVADFVLGIVGNQTQLTVGTLKEVRVR